MCGKCGLPLQPNIACSSRSRQNPTPKSRCRLMINKRKCLSYRPKCPVRCGETSGLTCLNFRAPHSLCALPETQQQQRKDASAGIDQTSINHAEKFCPGLSFSATHDVLKNTSSLNAEFKKKSPA